MRYDAVLKRLLSDDPIAWANLLRLKGCGPLSFIDVEFHTTTARVDKLILVDEPQQWLIHIELQTSYQPGIGLRIVRYSGFVEYELELPVMSVLVLLTPDADGAECNGICHRKLPFREIWYDEFRFEVIRVWQQPAEFFLQGGLGTLPLALLSDIEFDELPDAIDQIKRRVDQEIPTEADRTEFWSTTEILLDAVYDDTVVQSLLKGIANMRESSVVIRYLEEGRQEGRQEGLRHFLYRMGTRRFGEPDDTTRQRIDAISDFDQLEQLAERILEASGWNELFRED